MPTTRGRLLGIGLPLTIAVGAGFAVLLFTDLSVWEAAVIGAVIAPTDAALGQAVISNPRVPERIRQALDVESGLNDGISLPFVIIFIGLAEQAQASGAVETFAREIGVAVGVGLVVGVAGGWAIDRATKAGWIGPAWSSLAVISIAFLAFIVADQGGGSGFVATFVAGLSYGHVTTNRITPNEFLAGTVGLGLVQVGFLTFGALILINALENATWQMFVMALLALTAARFIPVVIAMIGTRLRAPTLLHMGWFGPRGLATIVFGALVAEDADLAGIDTIVAVAAITVGMSVPLHGLTSYPGSAAYANWYEQQDKDRMAESKQVHHRVHPHLSRLARRARVQPSRGDDAT
ncbi:MAG: cation:proton antiporter [Acidimicrobiia bacterium]|nr:cation:proton antiporter [Acidimicrobiia bacterium]